MPPREIGRDSQSSFTLPGPLTCPRNGTRPATTRYDPTSSATSPGKTIINTPNRIMSRAAISKVMPLKRIDDQVRKADRSKWEHGKT